MKLLSEIRNRARFIVGPLFGLVAIGYFAYHAVQGERGLIAWTELRAELARAQTSLHAREAERRYLEAKTHLLNSDSLDPDLLEERARAMLGFGYPGEIVILTGRQPENTPAR